MIKNIKVLFNSIVVFSTCLFFLTSCQTAQKSIESVKNKVKVNVEQVKFKSVEIQVSSNKNITVTNDGNVLGIEKFSVTELLSIASLVFNNPSKLILKNIQSDVMINVENQNYFLISALGFDIDFFYENQNIGNFKYNEKLEFDKNKVTDHILNIKIPVDISYSKFINRSNQLNLNGKVNFSVLDIKFPVPINSNIQIPIDTIKNTIQTKVANL